MNLIKPLTHFIKSVTRTYWRWNYALEKKTAQFKKLISEFESREIIGLTDLWARRNAFSLCCFLTLRFHTLWPFEYSNETHSVYILRWMDLHGERFLYNIFVNVDQAKFTSRVLIAHHSKGSLMRRWNGIWRKIYWYAAIKVLTTYFSFFIIIFPHGKNTMKPIWEIFINPVRRRQSATERYLNSTPFKNAIKFIFSCEVWKQTKMAWNFVRTFFYRTRKKSKVKAKTKERHQVWVPFHFRNWITKSQVKHSLHGSFNKFLLHDTFEPSQSRYVSHFISNIWQTHSLIYNIEITSAQRI